MKNLRGLSLVLAAGFLFVAAACTPKTGEQAEEVSQTVEDKAKEIAEETADKTKEIAGEIADKSKEAVSATGELITDGWITAKITTKLADEKELKNSKVNVDTKDRVVTLKGTVASNTAKARAASVAEGTEGVARVVNELTVKSP
jgi:hyperosmotically inducible protein